METIDLKGILGKIGKNKYVFLVLLLGLTLLLLPRGGKNVSETAESDVLKSTGVPLSIENGNVASLLSETQGVGRAEVLLSASGAVVVCDGADSALVRLNVTNAVMSYTGLGSDKITIIKMK